MRPHLLALFALLTLTACGVEGLPERPTTPDGASLTGHLETGIALQAG
jgi:hypothetical protein